ncbi:MULTISPECIES: hypothetical protein [unclassified Streptomyces]|uniref:hypothetical protein n=1 Tax=unclassified Streptomyces TaxID=2593676 RepID=UPI00224D54EB|nr:MULTISPECIES: hypothetical protein [unclassified Streptomyces]MCX4632509.1 hypothetical protein [Streptomyces sp. NBC_01443]WSW49276.1 hypothetical protein OG296_40070 [Streptomyces sp. NBC_01001]
MKTVLAACVAASALVLAVPSSASAAHGMLIIDGAAHHSPSGCFPLGDFVPPVVSNYTDSVIEVWSGYDCTGQVDWRIHPGETYHPNGNRSIFVP